MKSVFSVLVALLLCYTGLQAQNVTVPEPEFTEVTLLLTSDTSAVKLARENATVKSKAGASLYLFGIGKVKSRITLKGRKSLSKAKGGKTTRLIIKADNNNTDPNSFINIFKFEVKGNERRFQVSETGTLSPTEVNSLSAIEYDAKKYGESSYLLTLTNLERGEYGIYIGDPDKESTKNGLKITTFTVKYPLKEQ